MAKVELKQPIVAEISELLDGAATAVVVDYRGLTVAQDTELRKQLREAGVTYKVYKNTMIRFAAKGTEFEALEPHLEGPTALAVSKEDATAGNQGRCCRRQLLRRKGNAGYRNHPVQRSSSGPFAGKHAVSDCKLRSCA